MSGHLTSRRGLLSALGACGLTGSLAGCLEGIAGFGGEPTDTTTVQPVDETLAEYGIPSVICEEEIREDPNIPAVVDPTVGEDWSDVSVGDAYGSLTPETPVIGIERGGEARAYPVPILTHHEVVNGDFGGPLLVTYCPLCSSGMVAERRVQGTVTKFHVSGLLWKAPRVQADAAEARGDVFGVNGVNESATLRNNGNLVMYDDHTRSYWSQIVAQAICGPATGESLTQVPARTATWRVWRESHPETTVLLPPPHSGTDGR